MIAAASNQSAPSSTHKPAILPLFDDAMARVEVSPAHRPHWRRWVESRGCADDHDLSACDEDGYETHRESVGYYSQRKAARTGKWTRRKAEHYSICYQTCA